LFNEKGQEFKDCIFWMLINGSKKVPEIYNGIGKKEFLCNNLEFPEIQHELLNSIFKK
jgi:hypothetical protein